MNREPFNQDKFNGGLNAMLLARVGMLRLDIIAPYDQQKAQAVMDDVWACSAVNGQIDNISHDDQQASLRDDVSLIDHLAEAMFYIRNKETVVKPENPLTIWVINYLERSQKMWMAMGRREALKDFDDTFMGKEDYTFTLK